MKRLLLLFLLFPCVALAQTDPLNSAYKPSSSCTQVTGIWVTDTMQKIIQSNSTPGTGCSIQVYATQGEFADFQVHVVSPAGFSALNIVSSGFTQAAPDSSTPIPAPDATHNNVLVYREGYTPVSTLTAPAAGSYYTTTGNYPDSLIPTIDPYFHQTTNAFPVVVNANQTQSAWVDVLIPPTAKSGYYSGTITVSNSGTTIATLPIIIAVWQWPASQGGRMPATSTLPSQMQYGFGDFCNVVFGSSGNCPGYGGISNGFTASNQADVDGAVLFLDHRWTMNDPIQGGLTSAPFWQHLWDGNTASLTSAKPMLVGAKQTSFNFRSGGNGFSTQQAQATNFGSFIWPNSSSNFPSVVSLNYSADEPGNVAANWTNICSAATTGHGATPPLPQMVASKIEDMNANSGQNCVDIMTALITLVDCNGQLSSGLGCASGQGNYPVALYNTWKAGTNPDGIKRSMWLYTDCFATSCGGVAGSLANFPMYNIDAKPTNNRSIEWMNQFYGATGQLYFYSTCLWESSCGGTQRDGWVSGWLSSGNNGDGTLVYPSRYNATSTEHVSQPGGARLTTDLWIPSIRLKHMRDGMQDWEYMNALNAAGKGAVVTTQVNSWITNAYTYEFSGTGLQAARTAMGNALHALTFGAPPWTGIIDPSRAINWSNAGVLDANGLGVGNGGAGIPSGTWTQSGTTINPYGPSQSPGGDAATGSAILTGGSTTMTLLSGGPLQSYWPGLDLVFTSQNAKFTFATVNAGGPGSTFTTTVAPTALQASPTTTGTISSGSNSLSVASVSGASVGDGILVVGAGASGGNLITTINTISGTTLTLAANASTSVSAASVTYGSKFRGGGALDPSTIQTALNACGTNHFVLLGPGTFNLDGGLIIPSNCVLRGSGPNQTFLNGYYIGHSSSCGNTSNFICMSSDGTSYGTPAAFPNGTQAATFAGASTTSTVTTGVYAQNGNFISVSGVGSSGIKVGQWIYLTEQDELTDNGSYFNCQSLNVNPVCSFEGAAGAGMSPVAGTWYQQQQIVQVTSIPTACGTSCTGAGPFTLGITPGIYGLHWISGLSPYAWWPLSVTQNAGVENLAIDTLNLNPTNVSGTVGIAFTNAVNSWVKGVQSTHGNLAHIWESPAAHITVQDSYLYSTINAASQSYGIEPFGPTSDSLAQNNICQQVVACFIEGPQMGSVYFGNFSVDAQITPNTILSQQTVEHDTAVMYNLYDQNIGQGLYSDPFHGTHGLNTAYRNRWMGHECTLTSGSPACTTQGAWVVEDRAYNRMENFVGNVFGTTGFHGTAANCSNTPSPCYENTAGQNAIFYTQAGGGETSNIVSISVDNGTGTAYTAVVGSAFPTTGGIGGNITVAGVTNTSYNNAPGAVYVVTSVSNNTPSGQATIHMTGPNQTLTASSGGTLGPIVPNDPLVTSTMLRWGNFDVVSNAVRWCASGHTGFTTTCNSTSEVAPGIGTGINYFNAVPTLGDTGAAMPASLYYTSKPTWWPAGKPWPAIGPDVTGGNIGQCSGGSFPFNNATSSSQCTGGTFTASDTAGHANSNPAMDCFLNVMAGPPDGSGPSLPFGGSGCPSTMAPTVTLLPATLAFGNQNINTTSNGLAVTLTNTSALNVVVTQAQVFGTNFTLINIDPGAGNCYSINNSVSSFTLPAGQSCVWHITFSPTATTGYTGTFQVTDNASGSPQTINMTGQGTQATIVWSSPQGGTTYNYGSILVNTPTNSANLTLQNTGTGPLNVALTITGANAAQFSIASSTCPNPLPAGNNCTVVVTFTSIAAASYTAFLTETDSLASNSPQNLTLNGTGVTSVPISAPWPIMVISQNRSPKNEICDPTYSILDSCWYSVSARPSSRTLLGSFPHYWSDGL